MAGSGPHRVREGWMTRFERFNQGYPHAPCLQIPRRRAYRITGPNPMNRGALNVDVTVPAVARERPQFQRAHPRHMPLEHGSLKVLNSRELDATHCTRWPRDGFELRAVQARHQRRLAGINHPAASNCLPTRLVADHNPGNGTVRALEHADGQRGVPQTNSGRAELVFQGQLESILMQRPNPVPLVALACCKCRCQRLRQRTARHFGTLNPGAALGRHLTGRIRPRFHDRDRQAAARQPHRSGHAGQAAVDHQHIAGIQDGKIARREVNGHGNGNVRVQGMRKL